MTISSWLFIAAAIILTIVGFVVFYWLIKKAIRTAMADHYKTVLVFEQTGEWILGPHPKGPPGLLADGSPNPAHLS